MLKIMISTALPSRYFGTHRQCFAAFRLTLLAYSDGRKRENCSVWKDRILVASTYRRSVQFGCYITWLWMANCPSVMIKMLHLYNFTTLAMADEHGKRHTTCAHLPEAVSDWLNPFSLGTMSALHWFSLFFFFIPGLSRHLGSPV